MRRFTPLCFLPILLLARGTFAQGTSAFTYQGQLELPSGPPTGTYQMVFRLYDAPTAGGLRAGPLTNSVAVSNGLFTTLLDFGGGFGGLASLWLEIGVRTNGSLAAHTLLAPRHRLTPVPYAIYAARAGDLQSGASPTFTGNVTFNPASGPPFTVGNTTKVPNLNADFLDGFDSSAFVLKGGDTMTGNLTLANPATLNFGSSVRQMLNLWGSSYGIGVQAGTLYFRSDASFPTSGNFAWYRGGTHGDGQFDPGGGTALMLLSSGGNLQVNSSGGGGVNCLSTGSAGFVAALNGQCTATSGETHGVRGLVASAQGNAVYGINNNSSGVGLYGINGGGNGLRVPAGVYGESTAPSGNGVVGVAHDGPSAYGIWGRSTSGYAGVFDGAVRVNFASPFDKPQLEIQDPANSGFARVRMHTGSRAAWDIAVGSTPSLLQTNSLRFFSEGNGDVMTLSTNGNLFVRVLTITGGADISEPFKMSQLNLPKGAVVIIDEDNPGHLKLSAHPYDTRVAGIISGAGGVHPGLSLSQQGVIEGDQQVALSGRVYVQADASHGPIRPGDLLTTSPTPGYAMKVTDHSRAQGAIIGKAMTPLKEGKGLTLVLVSLQ